MIVQLDLETEYGSETKINFYFEAINVFNNLKTCFEFYIFDVELFSVKKWNRLILKISCCLIIIVSRLLYNNNIIF